MHTELALVLDDDAGGLVAAVLGAVHGERSAAALPPTSCHSGALVVTAVGEG